jgi:hypothetical protein
MAWTSWDDVAAHCLLFTRPYLRRCIAVVLGDEAEDPHREAGFAVAFG